MQAGDLPGTSAAIPAATLIVVRAGPGGREPEFLMVERSAAMAFAAGAIVFPGGQIDPADEALGAMLAVPEGAAAVAAIRETLEETAVPVGLSPVPSPDLAQQMQQDLLTDIPLATLIDRHGLRIDGGALTPFARWLPTFHVARRFDTHFFIAAAPPGEWQPVVRESENRTAEWLGASDLLRREKAGEAQLIFPTRCNLARLAQHADFEAMVEDARRHPVETISPWVEERGGARFLNIPEGLGYPVTRFPLEQQRRG